MARSRADKDREDRESGLEQHETLAEKAKRAHEAGESKPTSKPKGIVEQELRYSMNAASISGVSIASINREGKISTTVMGVTGKESKEKVSSGDEFGAASLSKPVFAYLVLKLIRG